MSAALNLLSAKAFKGKGLERAAGNRELSQSGGLMRELVAMNQAGA